MDNPLTPEQRNRAIEDALHTYPLASMPRDITADVLRRIQTAPAPRPFRLTWSDLALSVILSVCVAAIWFSLEHLPPIVAAQIRKETILFYQHLLVHARLWLPAIFFGIAGFLAALTVPYLRKELRQKSV